jgi:S-formylglutathione hydrolase FrmB
MALAEFRWFSNVLQKQVDTFVILPEVGKPPFATLYLLHGLTDDHTTWLRKTRLEVYAAEHPLMIVLPDGFRGYFTNNTSGPNYADYLCKELPSVIERNFAAKSARESRGIGGLSMGGYGAMRAALSQPDLYASAHSHSGSVMNGSRSSPPDRFPEAVQIFGTNPLGTKHDVVHLAEQARNAKKLPALRLDCGLSDFFLEENRQFHAALTELRIPHEYEEFPGDHNWDYWDLHIRQALAFHAGHLG